MSKHSPGPWSLSHDSRKGMEWNIHVVQENAPHLTVCFMTSDGPTEANARLIAAAPELLEALGEALATGCLNGALEQSAREAYEKATR